jgi:hypothetical protein
LGVGCFAYNAFHIFGACLKVVWRSELGRTFYIGPLRVKLIWAVEIL